MTNFNLAVKGDSHFHRSLPHEYTDPNGKHVRYEFLKELHKQIFQAVPFWISLGDLTETKNHLDIKIAEDIIPIYRPINMIEILGNHDSSRNLNQYSSLAKLFDMVLPKYKLIENIDHLDMDGYTFIFTSYYSNPIDIENMVYEIAKNNKHDRKIIVFGHWQFYNDLHKSGFKLQSFAVDMYKRFGVRWVLGHIHSHSFIEFDGTPVGVYLGCVNPLKFKEKQGKVMMINTKTGEEAFFDYPMGEKFIEVNYRPGETWMPEIENPETTYLKIVTDDLAHTPEIEAILKEKFTHVHYSNVSYRPEKNMDIEEIQYQQENELKTFEDHLVASALRKGYDPEEIMPYHYQIKEMVHKK